MKTVLTQFSGMSGRGLAAFTFLVGIMLFSTAAGAVYYPPSDRTVTWQGNVGVSGDVPNRTAIYKMLSPSGGDDTSAIQTAINNCPSGQVVQLDKGTFNVTKIDMKSNATLRGYGIGVTILKGTSTSSSYIVSFGTNAGLGTSVNLAGGYTKGSTSITASSSPGWSAGNIILIDQINNASGNPPVSNTGSDGTCSWCGRSSGARSLGQAVKVTAISGSTATLEMPLYWSFDPTLSPQGTTVTMNVQNAGLENLTIDNSTSMNANQQNNGTVLMNGAANCWLLKVDIYGVWEGGITMEGTYRCTVRSCRVHYSHAYTTSSGYGLWMEYINSADLVEDSIFDNLPAGLMCSGETSGNVIAYCYITNLYYTTDPASAIEALDNHGAHPIMNLWEGNFCEGTLLGSDHIWGTASHNTWFRNRVFYGSGFTKRLMDLNIWSGETYFNVIGNVIGTAGREMVYQSASIPFGTPGVIWVLGVKSSGNSPAGSYGLETTSLIRHGNWDSVTNGVVWDPTIPDHVLPPSLYLTAKPSWWPSAMPWPSIGPDLTPMSGTIPARQRYLLTPPSPAPPTVR